MSEEFSYQGTELDVFLYAVRWKAYWASRIARWIQGDVLEVGAGLGANTALLQNPRVKSWCCLEPDAGLVARLGEAVSHLPNCSAMQGTLAAVGGRKFDAILYMDVLEHIEADRAEMALAAEHLKPGGHVIVLGPAHQSLFSEFDAAIGHFRRYDRTSLNACAPPGCTLVKMQYLDSVGLLASSANRLLLRSGSPTRGQIGFWDTWMVPVSRVLDPLLGFRVGKSIYAVWQRSA